MMKPLLGIGTIAVLLFSGTASAEPKLCFLKALPQDRQAALADDVKLLIGWTFDAYAAGYHFDGTITIDHDSAYAEVPGFADPTQMQHLAGRYRIIRAPFDRDRGYYGILFAALDQQDRPVALILANRLFRAPVALQHPLGLTTDLLTNTALIFDFSTKGTEDALSAAEASYDSAAGLGVPLILAGQSQAGATAQFQAASLQKSHAGWPVPAGFLSINAAEALRSVRGLDLDPAAVDGINFSKDYDPGVGPHGPFANAIGQQVYIHPDGTGGSTPGDYSFFDALIHPKEHMLSTFEDISLTEALKPLLATLPDCSTAGGRA